MPQPDHEWFSQQIIHWQKKHGRSNLPWQSNPNPYRVWVSEIMLQQTQVSTVIDYYQRFMSQYPTIKALAHASEEDILTLWSGLGYYSRARNLHKTAQIINHELDGIFPKKRDELTALPGIGRSTAAAILALSSEQREAILDGNVKRVLCRFHAITSWSGHAATLNELWQLAEAHLPKKQLRSYTQGLMDLGSSLCSRGSPHCKACPLNTHCQAFLKDLCDKIPTPRPKKDRPKKQTSLLILFNSKQEILLIKRPPTGIWGSLWSLPEIDKAATSYNKQPYQILTTGKKIKHQFSHFQLTMQPIYAKLQATSKIMERPDQGWYNIKKATKLALATPIKKILIDGHQPCEFNLSIEME